MKRPTIRDVAKQAGVGLGTVSRVLNNSPQVKPETRQRVLDAIQQLNFKPNSSARHLSRKTRIQNIGVITQTFTGYHSFAQRLRGVQTALNIHSADYEILFYSVSSWENYQERLAFITQAQSVEGLLIIDLDLSDEQQQALQNAGIPFVGINNFVDRNWICISTDNIQGGYLATRHLINLGHERIAYVADEFTNEYGFETSAERYCGYEQALNEHRLKVIADYVQLGPHGYETAKVMTRQLLESDPRPTAIFAMTDLQALGCIAAIQEANLHVPQDISVIGYDDMDISYHIGLTTIRQHFELSGELAVGYLLRLMNGEPPGDPPELPDLKLIERSTTRSI